jgi:hypothetical protein
MNTARRLRLPKAQRRPALGRTHSERPALEAFVGGQHAGLGLPPEDAEGKRHDHGAGYREVDAHGPHSISSSELSRAGREMIVSA